MYLEADWKMQQIVSCFFLNLRQCASLHSDAWRHWNIQLTYQPTLWKTEHSKAKRKTPKGMSPKFTFVLWLYYENLKDKGDFYWCLWTAREVHESCATAACLGELSIIFRPSQWSLCLAIKLPRTVLIIKQELSCLFIS